MLNAICDAAITSAIFSRLAHLCKIIGCIPFSWVRLLRCESACKHAPFEDTTGAQG